MPIIDKLAELDEAALGILLLNAQRLAVAGKPKQRSDAADMLPRIEAEIAARKAAPAVKKAAASRRKPKP